VIRTDVRTNICTPLFSLRKETSKSFELSCSKADNAKIYHFYLCAFIITVLLLLFLLLPFLLFPLIIIMTFVFIMIRSKRMLVRKLLLLFSFDKIKLKTIDLKILILVNLKVFLDLPVFSLKSCIKFLYFLTI
jgi:hypothetical protein